MAKKNTAKGKGADRWRAAALGFPETEESDSCNKSAFKARGKSFLFLGIDDDSYNVMVKLGDSRAEVENMAAADPERISVGPYWVTAEFVNDAKFPAGLIERWLGESFRLVAPKKLVASYDDPS